MRRVASLDAVHSAYAMEYHEHHIYLIFIRYVLTLHVQLNCVSRKWLITKIGAPIMSHATEQNHLGRLMFCFVFRVLCLCFFSPYYVLIWI